MSASVTGRLLARPGGRAWFEAGLGELSSVFGVSAAKSVSSASLGGLRSCVGALGLKKPIRLLCDLPGVDFVEFSLLRATLPFFWGRAWGAEGSACRFADKAF